MHKKYHFSFMFHETKTLIPLDYETYEEALKDAKFYSHVFIYAAWNKAVSNRNFETTFQEFESLVGEFKLEPNESSFNFNDYFKTCYKFYEFSKEMENIWHGIVSQ